tara:strand:- start:262 stop:717 length:456 start_codon:yes stop_codon:yes gene_type:complete
LDGLWNLILFTGFIYVGGFMRSLIARSILVILGGIMVVMALVTIFSPEVGNRFLPPIELGDAALSTMIRTYAGFWLGCGYLTIRFVYSSSKVQIGSVLLYIFGCMIIGRLASLFYDGYNTHSLISLGLGIILFLSLYTVHQLRKNQLDYNL